MGQKQSKQAKKSTSSTKFIEPAIEPDVPINPQYTEPIVIIGTEDYSLTKEKWEITIDTLMIVGKYFLSSSDFTNVMKLAKKYHDLTQMYHFNPIDDTSLFENMETQYLYSEYDVEKEGITSIGKECFYECKSFTSVQLPSSLRSIGENTFSFTNIEKVEVPNNCIIGKNAFDDDCEVIRK